MPCSMESLRELEGAEWEIVGATKDACGVVGWDSGERPETARSELGGVTDARESDTVTTPEIGVEAQGSWTSDGNECA